MYSILLTPKRGELFNNEVKEIKYYKDDPFEKNFDFVYKLDKVTPCSFL